MLLLVLVLALALVLALYLKKMQQPLMGVEEAGELICSMIFSS